MTQTLGLLHTVNKSPFQTATLQSCLAHLSADAALLLIEDGVYAALPASPAASALRELAAQGRLYALGPDLTARGLGDGTNITGLQVIDYPGFVALAARHRAVQSWF